MNNPSDENAQLPTESDGFGVRIATSSSCANNLVVIVCNGWRLFANKVNLTGTLLAQYVIGKAELINPKQLTAWRL